MREDASFISSWLMLFYFAVITLIALHLARRRLRLHSIPGPFLASITDLWRWRMQNQHRFEDVLADLHQKYGSVVRVGPNTVSFDDPHVVPLIYDAHGHYRKADSYATLRSVVNGSVAGSVIDLQDEDKISQLRRAVGHVFAAKNVVDYEDIVQDTRTTLIRAMKEDERFDVFTYLGRFQADFLLRVAFGEESQFLSKREDCSHLSFEKRFQHWTKWQPVPLIERLLFKPPWLLRYMSKAPPLWARMANAKLQDRLTRNVKATDERQDLLAKYLEGGERRGDKLPLEAIPRMVSSTVSAGFDTTAFTMTAILYYLCRTPYALRKLREELKEAKIPLLPQYSDTKALPYLNAVLKEAMRLYPFLQLLLEREVPAGGAVIGDKHLPPGTVVACHPGVVGRNRSFYGDDASEFRPERWLLKDSARISSMERASLGFGNGKRICLGRHLAEMEIMTVIPALVATFDFRLADPNYVLEPHNLLTSFPKPVVMIFNPR